MNKGTHNRTDSTDEPEDFEEIIDEDEESE